MKMSVKVALTTVGVAVLAFFAGPLLFTPAPELDPSGVQLGLLMGVMAVESVALGLGVAFLIFGWPLVRRVVGPHRGLALGAYVSSGWLLTNWWLHDNLHIANGMNINGLIAIDYAFHTTLIAAGAVVAWALVQSIREGRLSLTSPVVPDSPAELGAITEPRA